MISVVIRAKNEGHNLKRCIPLLQQQTLKNQIIIVDSDSVDDTKQLCNDFNVTLLQCDEPFSYGKSLNVGIECCTTEFVCILSAHCFPVNDVFLYHLMNSFDKYTAGVYSRQIPHKSTNPVEYRNFLHIYGPERIVQRVSPQFNNGASMIRKSIWDSVRFDESVIAQEDILWARDVIRRGYRIVYEPLSIVEHLHNEDIVHTVSRYERESRALDSMGYLKW